MVSSAVRLANPHQAALPVENLPMASRVFASGMWNYAFFQFYPEFVRPHWVARQYDHRSPGFAPRGATMLSVNLTHRNWAGLRSPEGESFAVVDPAGAVSPVAGYYSLELALYQADQIYTAPTPGDFRIRQKLVRGLPVFRTSFRRADFQADWTVAGSSENPEILLCSLRYRYTGATPARIGLCVRPFNVEGPAPISRLEYRSISAGGGGEGGVIALNGSPEISLLQSPDRIALSNLEQGDAIRRGQAWLETECPFGVCTAVFHYQLKRRGEILFVARNYQREHLTKQDAELLNNLFTNAARNERRRPPRLKYVRDRSGRARKIKDLQTAAIFDPARIFNLRPAAVTGGINRSLRKWRKLTERGAEFHCARPQWNEAAQAMRGHLLSLQTAQVITPGAYTYHMFFFRDAAYMLSALMAWNYLDKARRVVERYPERIDRNGFFRSQEGEWDSNGQAIWTIARFADLAGDQRLLNEVFSTVLRGAEWIVDHRRRGYQGKLLPAGFSAEHLGPADYYYWDNLWSIGGLRETVQIAEQLQRSAAASRFRSELESYRNDFRQIAAADLERLGALPAGPGRPLDCGMIGGLPELYPLRLGLFSDVENRNTLRQIERRFCDQGLFLQNIIHSGYNVYLSLQLAQCWFVLGDVRRARKLLKAVLRAAAGFWTYPEGIHPQTGGGCMGDGFHGWAFAEALLLLREFVVSVREDRLRLFAGLRRRELHGGELRFGPFPVGSGARLRISGQMGERRGELLIEAPEIARSGIKSAELNLPALRAGGNLRLEGARLQRSSSRSAVLIDLSERICLRYEV
ncbi:MAG: hypothetical protein K1X75_15405 [Leptospirales bacterium]|nr:hypothetical protein [Leptospirales bacterium]